MTTVAFHFGAPDKAAYVCRLLRKAVVSGASVAVVAERGLAERLDADLWAVGASDFVPHCTGTAPLEVRRRSPVVISSHIDMEACRTAQVLVQLLDAVPDGVSQFSRVIEVVSLEDEDRARARGRWRAYAGWHMPIQKHDLTLREQS